MNKQVTAAVPTRLRVKPSPADSSDARSAKTGSDSFSPLLNGQNGFDVQKAEEKYTAQGSRKINRDTVPLNKEKEDGAYPAPSLSERAPMLYSNLQSYISSRKLSADKVQDPSVGPSTPAVRNAFKTASPSPSPQGMLSGGNGTVDLSTESGGGALEIGDILGTTQTGRYYSSCICSSWVHSFLCVLQSIMCFFSPCPTLCTEHYCTVSIPHLHLVFPTVIFLLSMPPSYSHLSPPQKLLCSQCCTNTPYGPPLQGTQGALERGRPYSPRRS